LCAVLLADLPLRRIAADCRGSRLGPSLKVLNGDRARLPADVRHRLTRDSLRVTALGFVDDVTLAPADLADLAAMIAVLQRWCELSGFAPAMKKFGWMWWRATDGSAAIATAPPSAATVPFFGLDYPESTELRMLGVDFVRGDPFAHTQRVLARARITAERVGRMKHCGADGKAVLLRGLVVQAVAYGALIHNAAPGTPAADGVALLQSAMDAAVRGAAASASLATGVLRLPPNMGGLGCPSIRAEMDIARVAEFQRVLNGGSLAARALWIELDRVGSIVSFTDAAAPQWPDAHPLEHRCAIREQHSGYNRSSDVGRALCAATRRLGVCVKLQRPAAASPQRWQPRAEEYPPPVQRFAADLAAAAAAVRPAVITACSDGGYVPAPPPPGAGGGEPPKTTAGVAAALGDRLSDAEGALVAGWRFEGHGSSYAAELGGLEALLFAAVCVRVATAGATAVHCFTDSLSSITSVEALADGGRDRGQHRTRVERCAELIRQSGATLDFTAGHASIEDLAGALNDRADRAATGAVASTPEATPTPEPRPRRLVAAATVISVGVEVEARATRALRRIAADDELRRLRAGHAALPAASAREVHLAPLRIARWRGLRALPGVGAPSRWEVSLLRRARGGGFAVYGAGAECALCGQSMVAVPSAVRWEHAVAECTGAKRAELQTELSAALQGAAERRAAEQLRSAEKAAGQSVMLLVEAHATAVAALYAAALTTATSHSPHGHPALPAQPRRRRQRPPRLAAVGAWRAARSALSAGRSLTAEMKQLLRGGTDARRAVMMAMLPGADQRRGDGALLSAVAHRLAHRADRWLKMCDAARFAAHVAAARTAAVGAATALLATAAVAPVAPRRRRRGGGAAAAAPG
jgi:hypothetical protein